MSDFRECSSRDIRSCRAVNWVDWMLWADNRFPTISSRASAREFSVCNADREPRVTSARLATAVQPEQINVPINPSQLLDKCTNKPYSIVGYMYQ